MAHTPIAWGICEGRTFTISSTIRLWAGPKHGRQQLAADPCCRGSIEKELCASYGEDGLASSQRFTQLWPRIVSFF